MKYANAPPAAKEYSNDERKDLVSSIDLKNRNTKSKSQRHPQFLCQKNLERFFGEKKEPKPRKGPIANQLIFPHILS